MTKPILCSFICATLFSC